MYKVIIEWHDNFCRLNEESDFYQELRPYFPMANKSKDDIEEKVYNVLKNLFTDHYGNFCEQTEIIHKIIF